MITADVNPFNDVPHDHWAREAIVELASKGIIEGYGDGTFLGDHFITRYEMAQMIARALAKNPRGEDRATLDRLAAEFSYELQNLGVRVDELAKHDDNFELHGELAYTYLIERHAKRRQARDFGGHYFTLNDLLLRLNGAAGINDHWEILSRVEANLNTATDEPTLDLRLERAWAQGTYDDLTLKLGKIFYFTTYDYGFMLDTEFSGAQVEYGRKWRANLSAGRLNNRSNFYADVVYDDDHDGIYEHRLATESSSDLRAVELKYLDNRWNGGLGYYEMSNDGFASVMHSDTARIAEASLNYRFDKNVELRAAYVKNLNLRDQYNVNSSDTSYNLQFQYKGFKFEEPGSYTLWIAYRSLGYVSTIKTLYKDVMFAGQEGWDIGTYYTIFPNIVATLQYFYGKDKEFRASEANANKFLTCVEFFF